MTLTNFQNILNVTKGDPAIQALQPTDPLVVMTLADMAVWVPDAPGDSRCEMKQRYAAAHLLALATRGARGLATSESIGGISQNFSPSEREKKSYWWQTQYGQTYWRLVEGQTVGFAIGIPGGVPPSNPLPGPGNW